MQLQTQTCEKLAEFFALLILRIWNPEMKYENLIVEDPEMKNLFVTLATALQRVFRLSKVPISCVITALIYLKRLQNHLAGVQINAIYRAFTVSLVIAQKYNEDSHFANVLWARVTGIPLAELTEMERDFLRLTCYGVSIQPAEFNRWKKVVQTEFKGFLVFKERLTFVNSIARAPDASPDLLPKEQHCLMQAVQNNVICNF